MLTAGKLNQVVGEQWTWNKTPAEKARNTVNSLESLVLDDDMFSEKERYDSPDRHHMIKAMRYSVKKKVGFQADAMNDSGESKDTTASHQESQEADCVLEEHELQPQHTNMATVHTRRQTTGSQTAAPDRHSNAIFSAAQSSG